MTNTDNIEKIDLDKLDWRSSREFFESLGEELDKLDDKDESYNFTWVGKRKSIIEAGAPINKTLRPDMDASKNFDNTKNMLIVGDNLDALKLLQESYLGQIKMIYIDPPYNTGHDFVYHDNFTVKKSDYEDNTTDSEGNKIISEDEFTENAKSNGRFHSDWLSMMYPRLKLARNLLADDGVIFISIDDNEHANLKKICDQIFDEDNFISTFIWEKTFRPSNLGKTTRKNSEYILSYSRKNDIELSGTSLNTQGDFSLTKKNNNSQILHFPKNTVNANFGNGTYRAGDYGSGYKLLNDITVMNNKVINDFSLEINASIWSQSHLLEEIERGVYLVIKNPNTMVVSARKVYKQSELKPTTLLPNDKVGDVLEANNEITQLLWSGAFDYPKPVSLIRYLLNILPKTDANDYFILDFFAGSGTTGHAVMDLNAEDGGNRKYILVQLDEPTDDKSEAKKAGYDTIDQITAERLRRAGDKIIKEHPDLEGKLDTGFRVFHIDSANEREDIRKSVYDTKQEDMFDSIDNIKHDRTPLDLLFGTIIYMALPLGLKLEVKNINNNTIYFYGYQDEGMGLIACFDDNISDETVKEIAKLKPLTAVFKDSSFKDSAAKINLSEIFRTISNETRVKVI